MSVRQGWIERLLGVGSVRLRSDGRDMVLAGVKEPEAVAELIRRRDPGPCTPKNPCNPCGGKDPSAKEGEKADAPE